MPSVLSIQDLSCMGKCSLTVALPILSAMGLSTSVLPTAVLSTHTGFPSPVVQPMTENLLPFADHMASVGGEFDTLCTGYLSDPHQAKRVGRSQHGTGDMFAAVTAGALTLGKNLPVAATLAARFVEQTIQATPASTPFGANFEPILPWLWQQL